MSDRESLFAGTGFNPDWEVPPAPEGDDEPQAADLYRREAIDTSTPWDELPEWIRESWRREYRDA